MGDNKFENLDQLLASNEDTLIIELFDFLSDICDYGEKLEVLNLHQKVFYLIEVLEMEINNGGFSQYFFNSYGEFAPETVQALIEIKAHKTSVILQEAINAFPNQTFLKDRVERQSIMEEIEDEADSVWEELYQKFYAYEDNLTQLLIDYIKQHKSFF